MLKLLRSVVDSRAVFPNKMTPLYSTHDCSAKYNSLKMHGTYRHLRAVSGTCESVNVHLLTIREVPRA